MAKRKRRDFTPKFKAEVVLEALRGESSQAELCQRHSISEEQLSTWKRQLLLKMVISITSHATQAMPPIVLSQRVCIDVQSRMPRMFMREIQLATCRYS